MLLGTINRFKVLEPSINIRNVPLIYKTGGSVMSGSNQKKAGKNDNIVFVGKKPTMSYVLAVITQFSDGMPEVNVKARGRSISRAVDVVEVVRNRFMNGLNYGVEFGTEEVMDENNSKLNVSTIHIKLSK